MAASVYAPLTKHGANRTIGFQPGNLICLPKLRSDCIVPSFRFVEEVLRQGKRSQAAPPPREGSSH
jgi:hypothetical protein